MRPTELKKDNTLYWVIRTYTSAGVLVDADSIPSVAVRKNGASTVDAVTITKRSATTGIYDCSYNPAGEVEGDCFTIEESATISSQAYEQSFSVGVIAAERGTDGANTVTPVDVSSDITAVKAVTDKIDTMLDSETSDIFSGFESGFDGWTAVAYFGGNASHTTVSTAQARTGNQSIRMINDGSNGSNDRTGIVRTETFGSGATVSGYFYSTNTNASSEQRIEFWLDGVFSSSQNPTAGQTWEAFSFNVPTGSHDIALVRYSDENNGSSQVHLDDITITGVASSDYQYTAGSLDQAPSGGGGDATAANQTQLLADIAALNDFNPATDPVANVTLVATTTTNTDMRGTDGANTVAPVDVSSDVTAILADTNELQLNQGNWLTATGFNTVAPDNAGIAANNSAINALNDLSAAEVENAVWDAAVTSHTVAGSYGIRSLVALNSNRTVQITGSHHTAADVHEFQPDTITSAATDASFVTEIQSGLSTFDASTDQVVASNMRGTDGANTVTPNTVAPDNASIALILADTNELQLNQGDWATATGFSTHGAADVVTAMDAVKDGYKADVSGLLSSSAYTLSLPSNFDLLVIDGSGEVTASNAGSGSGSGHTAADVVTAMQVVADDFKADVSGLSTQASVDVIDGIVDDILADTNELQGNQGDWATATTTVASNMRGTDNASTHDAASVVTALQAVADSFKADTSGLSTHDAAAVVSALQAVADSFKADVSGLSTHDAGDVAAVILSNPSNLILTNSGGQVQTSNGGSGGGGNIGSGAIAHTVSVSVGGSPLAGADVWVTTDQAGNFVVAGTLVTDASGSVTFQLDAGDYYQWVQLSGYNFSNPSSITVQ